MTLPEAADVVTDPRPTPIKPPVLAEELTVTLTAAKEFVTVLFTFASPIKPPTARPEPVSVPDT